ncbi:MAG: hypothetical protein ACK5QS_04240 [Pseudanabaenaceae cyanobacterium]
MNMPMMLQCSFVSIVGLLCLSSGNAIANSTNSNPHQVIPDAMFQQSPTTINEPPTPPTTPYHHASNGFL